jgi:hypothetical protein
MVQEMPAIASKRFMLKKLGIILAGLLFLGGFEISAYPHSGNPDKTITSLDYAQIMGGVDVILVQDGEETEVERDIGEYFAVPAFSLSDAPDIRGSLTSFSYFPSTQQSFYLQGPRAPPIH